MSKSLMICTNTKDKLHLNESDYPENSNSKKYILTGIFAHLGIKNRNERVYTKEEYLKHLQYLREDIKSGEPLLGELDHPDDRFEVKLKEASHRVIDLWYDANTNCVMGKIELLNTPNGKLAQSMIDQGIPLHISSRAAGTVNADHTVSIQQIYTYDLVCKPGFADAVLHRVDESVSSHNYSDATKSFLTNAMKMESLNAAPQYGIINENVSVSEIKAPVILRKEAKALQINKQTVINEDMSKPLLENNNPDATTGKPLSISGNSGAAALGVPVANLGGTNETSDSSTDSSTADVSETTDKKDEKVCPECGKIPCECDKKDDHEEKETNECNGKDCEDDKEHLNSDDNTDASTGNNVSEDEDESKENDDDSDSKEDAEGDNNKKTKKDSGIEILDVTAEFEDGDKDEKSDDKKENDMIKDVEPEYVSDDKSKDEDNKESKESDDEDNTDETSEAKDEDTPCDEDDKCAKDAKKLNDKAAKDIEKHKDSIFKKLDDLKASIEKKNKSKEESKCESAIMARYPVSMMMNESNFASFAALSESQKTKVVSYLQNNNITEVKSINESWKNGIDYVQEIPTWLKFAPDTYKALYESASEQIKTNINNMAKYVLFESQYDINTFWENSGLAEVNERRLINESFVNTLPKVAKTPEVTSLPYSNDFIKNIADMASDYNNDRY